MLLTEDFLHYVWKYKLFDHANLQTTSGDNLEIKAPGLHNTNSGPDFENARLRISDTEWAGNVEIHLSSADWYKHRHQFNDAYNNVILHVVYKNDEVIEQNGRILPTLELYKRIPAELYNRYHQLLYSNQRIIPCEGSIGTVSDIARHSWLTRVLTERLQKKSVAVIESLQINRGNWDETFYQFLAANFGFKINALPFELLAKSLPQIILAKHKNNQLQIEALIFGQAGLLDAEFSDDYPNQLKREYNFLRSKYALTPVEKHLWKFMRLRPLNFPTVRLAQFAALTGSANHLFSKVLETTTISELRKLFEINNVNSYWNNHYRFDIESKDSAKALGKSSAAILLINTVAVVMFAYGKQHKLQQYIDRSLQLLEDLPVENNHVITDFASLGVRVKTAFESQALLELKNSYCMHKKCLQCGIGNKLINNT